MSAAPAPGSLAERLEKIEARLDHLEIASQRSLTQGTVYPIVSDVERFARTVTERLLAFEARLDALGGS